MSIPDYDSRFGERTLTEHAYRCPSSTGDRTPPADGLDLSVEAVAHVNHGRWIAACPFDGCYGAEYVSVSGGLFFCCECRNFAVGHHPIRVDLPAESTRAQVEAYLAPRPTPSVRNWTPEQPVKQLQAENREHGIRV